MCVGGGWGGGGAKGRSGYRKYSIFYFTSPKFSLVSLVNANKVFFLNVMVKE